MAPEKLLRAMLLQVFYSVRSERQFMEQAEHQGRLSGEHISVDGTLILAWVSHKRERGA